MKANNSLFKGTMLVAGTTIGGGMLGLPVLTSQVGFYPSLFVYILCWAFMAATGLLFLEVCLWMKGETNMVSMAAKTLGPVGKWTTWLLYLFLFCCLTVAYVVGGGNMLSEATSERLSDFTGSILFVIIFGSMVWAGADIVSWLNLPLMLGLGASFFAFMFVGFPYIDFERLNTANWDHLPKALPIIFASFGFQGLVPTLTTYMDFDAGKTRKAILIGSAIPLITYMIWQALIMGIVPLEGDKGLLDALAKGHSAVRPLKYFIHNPAVIFVGAAFAFFAITTSFLGVTLGLLDFLADGLSIEKTPMGRLFLCLLIFLPSLAIAGLHPDIFLKALDLAGGIGVAGLLGFMPILMIWQGRYKLKMTGETMLPGGKLVLILLLVFVLTELSSEVLKLVMSR